MIVLQACKGYILGNVQFLPGKSWFELHEVTVII